MTDEVRQRLLAMTQEARALLEREFSEQLEAVFDIHLDGTVAPRPGSHLAADQKAVRAKLVAAIDYLRASGATPNEAVAHYLRQAAFTTCNRFAALKMLEVRGLVQECISRGGQSAGFKEYTGLAPGLAQTPDGGYRLYIESLFDEVGREVRALFDRRDPSSLLWPRRPALLALLGLLNTPDLNEVWGEDETIGWVYQYFNSPEERKEMREKSGAPRNSRELAVRNQFFTPRYVVEFLVDNTLGRLWYEMMKGQTALAELPYRVRSAQECFLKQGELPPSEGNGTYIPFRAKKDPRDLQILDPACGSGHFLLYAFDLLLVIYEEAWHDPEAGTFSQTHRTLRRDYASLEALHAALPALILCHNLYGIDIDPRAAQIAVLALWMRAQRANDDLKVAGGQRVPIERTNIVVAEPMPGDKELVAAFAQKFEAPVLGELFRKMVEEMQLAGELGSLLKIDVALNTEIDEAREQFGFWQEQKARALPGTERILAQEGRLFGGIDDEYFFAGVGDLIIAELRRFAEAAQGPARLRRHLFAEDATHGVALMDLMRKRFDVVLMNPPFGAGSVKAKITFDRAYPRTKNDLYAAFVERGIELLHPRGLLGAITSRTGFFLATFQKWREEILLKEAPPVVMVDLGYGVLDTAMVEVAAYCLEKIA
jgi:SAM-dependent methyltransferase